MGGRGSGTWTRWNRKRRVEELSRLSIQVMQKDGLLIAGNSFVSQWLYGEEVVDQILVQVHSKQFLVLSYCSASSANGKFKDFRIPISLQWLPCNYGGQRPYFECPDCGEKTAFLFMETHFRCRKCSQLNYSSTGERTLDRAMRKARKIRSTLGVTSTMSLPVSEKPKGIHWITFFTHCQKLREIEHQAAQEIYQRFQKAFRRPRR